MTHPVNPNPSVCPPAPQEQEKQHSLEKEPRLEPVESQGQAELPSWESLSREQWKLVSEVAMDFYGNSSNLPVSWGALTKSLVACQCRPASQEVATSVDALRDAYTFKKECVVGGEEELQYTVWLRIGNQSFTLDGYHNEEDAEYFRLMLGKAIRVILSEHVTKSDGASFNPKSASASIERLSAPATKKKEGLGES
jgi:hypothetical protein